MGRMHVAHLEAGALARQTARPERRQAPLMGDLRQRVGLVHELRQLRGAEELAHRGSRGLCVDQVLRHHRVDIDRAHALLDGALHAQQADAILVLHELADRAHPAIAEMVDVVDLAPAVAQTDQRLDDGEDVLAAQRAHGIRRIEIEAHVHLDPAHGRQVVALRIEEDAVEQRLRGLRRRRLARAHHPVDVEQRLVGVRVLVDRERVADEGADIDVVDVEDRDLFEAELLQRLEQLLLDLLARLAVDLAGLQIDDVLRQIAAVKVLVADEQLFQALLGELVGETRRHLAAGLDRHLAGLGVDQIGRRLDAAHAIGTERHAPSVLARLEHDAVVEGRQDLLVVEAERIEQRRHRQLAPAVDTHIDDVLGVELEVEPRAAIRNDARGEQQLAGRMGLAAVMVEEHARRAMHLRDDDALGAVDDEGAVHRHERHVAHIDVLLLDVLDGAGAGLLVDIEHDQAKRHLERRGEGHATLLALLDVVFRLLEGIADELELGALAEVPDREHGAEHGLQPLVEAPAFRLVDHQELIVGLLLNLDEVRHLRHFVDVPEKLTISLVTVRLLRHVVLSKARRDGSPETPLGRRRLW